MLNFSGLDRFLVPIQAHLPPRLQCMIFGNSVLCGNLQMIPSYYRAFPPDVLTPSKVKCNAAFRAASMLMEKNYGLQSCMQRLCDFRRGSSYSLEHPSAIKQLWVCQNVKTLLNKSLNIYDIKRTMFCLSFPLIDRATAPGRYEQSYLNVLETLTKNVPYPQKLISRTQSNQTRSGNNIL